MHSTSPRRSFTKKNRLTEPSAYKRVFSSRHRGVTGAFRWHTRPNNLDVPRLGLAVPKRKIRSAVRRNRLKRLIRESFRINMDRFLNNDIVIVARADTMAAKNVISDLEKIWSEISNLTSGQSSEPGNTA